MKDPRNTQGAPEFDDLHDMIDEIIKKIQQGKLSPEKGVTLTVPDIANFIEGEQIVVVPRDKVDDARLLLAFAYELDQQFNAFVERVLSKQTCWVKKWLDPELVGVIRDGATIVLGRELMLEWRDPKNAKLLQLIEAAVAEMGNLPGRSMEEAFAKVQQRVFRHFEKLDNKRFIEVAFTTGAVRFGELEGQFAILFDGTGEN